jgi:hypothetical protein
MPCICRYPLGDGLANILRGVNSMKNFGYVLAPKVLVNNKLKIRFMYREKPDNDNDSGWRFFSGDEDQEYVDNPNNIAIYDVETVLAQ